MTPPPTPSFEGMPYATLRRYVTGASDAAERRRVEEWAAESADRRAYLIALGRTWARTEAETTDAQRSAADAAWAALSDRLDVPADTAPPYVAPWEEPAVEIDVRRRRPVRLLTGAFERRRRWPGVAAAAAAVLIVAAGAVLLHEPALRPTGSEQPALMREVATAAGQRAEVKLGDGSTVTLGVESRLRFPADFGARSRDLHLEGEAYFVVAHDDARPFVVHAAGTKTIDIGTAFVLRAYAEDDGVQVVVTEGSVALGADRADAPAPVVLTKGHLGRLVAGATVPTVREVDPAAYTGWLHGRLVFDNTPLATVAAELGRWYDVEIQLADPSLARETFTASFAGESLAETLKTLTTVLDLRMERRGSTVVLRRRAR